MTTPRIVTCPTCRQGVKWTSKNQYRPFCSERCKLIDFGEWVREEHRIPDVEPADFEAKSSESESDC